MTLRVARLGVMVDLRSGPWFGGSVTQVVDADYLVVGAGATGMAFTDALLDHSDARVVLVDRRDGVGGHWRQAYPFVRLHQSSTFYGVASTVLGGGASSGAGPRPGSTSGPTSRPSAPTTTPSWRTGCWVRPGPVLPRL